jgi:hypothetical protein
MIGKVVFWYKTNSVEAVMEDDGTWRCNAIPCLVRPLNCLYSPVIDETGLDGRKAMCCLESAAIWLHGEVRTGRTERGGTNGDPPVYLAQTQHACHQPQS